jgi:hypothetical protein
MNDELLFSIANTCALVMWLLLAALPGRRWVTEVATTGAAALFAAAYVAILATAAAPADGGFGSLAGVAALFNVPRILLAGWLHYLAFDLLIGSWEVRDARTRGISHWLVVPCLLGTFMFGPAGWLAYMAVRTVRSGDAARTRSGR